MVRRLLMLVGFTALLSACASLPPDCTQIRSERWPVEHSWLLKQVDPGAVRAGTTAERNLFRLYREGDEIWTYQAPESIQSVAGINNPTVNGARDVRYSYATAQHRQRGYVLLRGCEAIYVIPSFPF